MNFNIKKILSLLTLTLIVLQANAQLFSRTSEAKKLFSKQQKTIQKQTKESSLSFYKNTQYFLVEFEEIPLQKTYDLLTSKGITVLDYYGKNIYTLSVPNHINLHTLKAAKIKNVARDFSDMKLSYPLRNDLIPIDKTSKKSTTKIIIEFYKNVHSQDIDATLEKFNALRFQADRQSGRLVYADVKINDVKRMAKSPIISYISIYNESFEPLNSKTTQTQKVNIMNAPTSLGGYNLQGEGVVVGIGDGGEVGDHLDFEDRVIDEASYSSQYQLHATHVHGTIGGAGIINENFKGLASECTMISENFSNLILELGNHANNYDMVLTTHAYGGMKNGCGPSYFGDYTSSSRTLDILSNDYPEVLNLYAAGNSGYGWCRNSNGNPILGAKFYGTVVLGPASSKNTLTVTGSSISRIVSKGQSHGPTRDGRIKPEITAVGVDVTSCGNAQDYYNNEGSSMAVTSATGTMALLVEQYRKTQGGSNPKAALMKAIACNTADDVDNYGPDYFSGFGIINGAKAAEVIANGQFLSDNISEGDSPNTHTISVASGISEVKVLLYWHDIEGTVGTAQALINDLNLTVTDPNGNVVQPWILDPAIPAKNAVRGEDNLNNIEQVTILTPTPGNYTITVEGKTFPTAVKTQDYVITYDFISPDIEITFPLGGESMVVDSVAMCYWDAPYDPNHTFTFEYSLDGGSTWIVGDNAIAANKRNYRFRPTASYLSNNVIFKVSKNGTTYSDQNSVPASILPMPEFNMVTGCDNTLDLSWNAYTLADEYEILLYENHEWTLIGTTTSLNYTVDENFAPNTEYWLTIRYKTDNGNKSLRAIAQRITTDDVACVNTAPNAPNNPTVTSNLSSLTIGWTDNSDNETGFRVLRATCGTSFSQIAVVGENIESYVDTNVSSGVRYFYKIKAYNNIGDSAPIVIAGTIENGQVPHIAEMPTNVVAEIINTTENELSWTDNSSFECAFKIMRSTNGSGYTTIATVGANSTSYTDSGLDPNSTYCYKVKAHTPGGWSAAQVACESAPTTRLGNMGSNNISIFPNPTTGHLNLVGVNNDALNITIHDVNGKQVKANHISSQRIDISNFANGVYILSIQTANDTIIKRIVKR